MSRHSERGRLPDSRGEMASVRGGLTIARDGLTMASVRLTVAPAIGRTPPAGDPGLILNLSVERLRHPGSREGADLNAGMALRN